MCSISDQPGPEPELDPPAGHVVGGRRELRQHRRMAEARRRDHRPQPQRRGPRGERVDRPPGVERAPLALADHGDVVVRTEERLDPRALAGIGQRDPVLPGHVFLAFDHQRELHDRESYPLRAVSRPLVWTLYAALRARLVEHVGRHRRRAGGHRPVLRRRDPLLARRCRAARGGDRAARARCARTGCSSATVGLLPVRHHLRPDLLGRAVRHVRPDLGPVRRAAALRRADGGRRCCRRSRCARGCWPASGSRSAASSSRSARVARPRHGRAHRARRRGRDPVAAGQRRRQRGDQEARRDGRPAGDERLGDARRRPASCSPSPPPPRTGARRSGRWSRSARSSIWPRSAPASRSSR